MLIIIPSHLQSVISLFDFRKAEEGEKVFKERISQKPWNNRRHCHTPLMLKKKKIEKEKEISAFCIESNNKNLPSVFWLHDGNEELEPFF